MDPELYLTDAPSEDDRRCIVEGLSAFNALQAGPSGSRPLAVLLRHPETGNTLGGLWARSLYDWLHVELLFVPDALRGRNLGVSLMLAAEDEARRRSHTGIHLDTFEFQARGFYARLGYEVFGVLEDHPRGARRYFMRKLLRDPT